MRIHQLLPILVSTVLSGCGEPPATGDGETVPKPLVESEQSTDRLPHSGGPISNIEDDAMHARRQSLAVPGNPPNDSVDDTPRPNSRTGDIDRLRDRALNAGEPEARIKALEALVLLAKEDAEAVLPTFEDAMRDSHEKVREAALLMIYKKSLSVSTEAMHEVAASDPIDAVRGRAWIALVERGGPEIQGYLVDALKDPNPDIRRDAQWELDKLELGIR